jgi:ASC-1-like (ASCH) protein
MLYFVVIFLLVIFALGAFIMKTGSDEEPITLRFSDEGMEEKIIDGTKKLDIRKGHKWNQENIVKGGTMNARLSDGTILECKITDVRKYNTVDELREKEKLSEIYPGCSDEEIEEKIERDVPASEINAMEEDGKIIVLEFEFIKKVESEE